MSKKKLKKREWRGKFKQSTSITKESPVRKWKTTILCERKRNEVTRRMNYINFKHINKKTLHIVPQPRLE